MRHIIGWTSSAILGVLLAVGASACDGGGGADEDTAIDTAPDTLDDGDAATDTSPDTEPDTTVDTTPDTAGDPDAAEDPDAPPAGCDGLVDGMNTGFMVDGTARSFILLLPTDVETGGPWPVIFGWHGMGDTPANFSMLLSPYVDSATMPFIGVVPAGTANPILGGLMTIDWDLMTVTENQKDARLFDEVLACLEERWGVDEGHVHSVGFSLGSMMVDALATVRSDVLASVATYSGAYGNDQDNLDTVPALGALVNWPAYSATNKYTQLILHGGATDTYNLSIVALPFSTFAANDSAWLNASGHDTILCNHNGGHSVPSDMYTDKIIEFFDDHPMGTTDSPYATDGLPTDFASYCTFEPSL